MIFVADHLVAIIFSIVINLFYYYLCFIFNILFISFYFIFFSSLALWCHEYFPNRILKYRKVFLEQPGGN